jgi:DnaK suppressor protein
MPAQKKLSKKDLEHFKKKLLFIREKIAGNLHNMERDSLNKSQKDAAGDLSGYSFHMADVATDNFDTEIHLGLTCNSKNLLNEVDDALKRIEEGSYGLCERYETPIPKKRLEVMPYARYCIKAQEEIEQERKQME